MRVRRIESGGSLKAEKAWGLRKLAYEIEKRTEADYRFFRFETESPLLDELNHNLRITDGVLRFRIFKVDPDSPVIEPGPPVSLAGASSGAPAAVAVDVDGATNTKIAATTASRRRRAAAPAAAAATQESAPSPDAPAPAAEEPAPAAEATAPAEPAAAAETPADAPEPAAATPEAPAEPPPPLRVVPAFPLFALAGGRDAPVALLD